MPWFVIQSERKTWTKYMVEAEDEEAAMRASDSWQYLGYVDGEETESDVAGGPFQSQEAAVADIVTYVEG